MQGQKANETFGYEVLVFDVMLENVADEIERIQPRSCLAETRDEIAFRGPIVNSGRPPEMCI